MQILTDIRIPEDIILDINSDDLLPNDMTFVLICITICITICTHFDPNVTNISIKITFHLTLTFTQCLQTYRTLRHILSAIKPLTDNHSLNP